MFRKLFLVSSLLVLQSILLSCGYGCNVYDIQEINGLAGNNTIVAYITRCGATTQNSISITWKEDSIDFKTKRGEIFYAVGGDNIKIEKISMDTVKVYYFAWDIETQKKMANNIVFIYEAKEPDFFKK